MRGDGYINIALTAYNKTLTTNDCYIS